MQFCVYATSIAIMIHVDYANLCQNVKSMRVIASGAITAQGAGITWNFIVQIIFLYFWLFVLTTNVLCFCIVKILSTLTWLQCRQYHFIGNNFFPQSVLFNTNNSQWIIC